MRYLILLFLSVGAMAEDVERILLWNPNPEPDLMEYRLYVGVSEDSYEPPITVLGTSKTLNLPKDILHFAKVTAVNTSGIESEPSRVLCFQVFRTGEGKVPSQPVGLRVGGPLQVSLEQSSDLINWSPIFTHIVQSTFQDFFRVKLESK